MKNKKKVSSSQEDDSLDIDEKIKYEQDNILYEEYKAAIALKDPFEESLSEEDSD